MYALSLSRQMLVAPGRLQEWQWGKALGVWLAAASLVLFTLGVHWPALFMLALHVMIDATGKFGLKHPWGLVADQLSHLVALVLIMWLYG